jgi:hypothetical protein
MKKVNFGLKIAIILALFLLVQCVQASWVPGWSCSYYKNQLWSGTATSTNDQVFIQFASTNTGYPSAYADWPFGIIGQYQDFSMICDGYVDIPNTGSYTFTTLSDDGVELFVDGIPVISNTGDHGPMWDTGMINQLPAGYQRVTLNYRENMWGFDPTEVTPGNYAVIYLGWLNDAGEIVLIPGWHMSSTPTPEFPSAFLPAVMIIGFLGTVLYIQRTREH